MTFILLESSCTRSLVELVPGDRSVCQMLVRKCVYIRLYVVHDAVNLFYNTELSPHLGLVKLLGRQLLDKLFEKLKSQVIKTD